MTYLNVLRFVLICILGELIILSSGKLYDCVVDGTGKPQT